MFKFDMFTKWQTTEKRPYNIIYVHINRKSLARSAVQLASTKYKNMTNNNSIKQNICVIGPHVHTVWIFQVFNIESVIQIFDM